MRECVYYRQPAAKPQLTKPKVNTVHRAQRYLPEKPNL